MIHATSSGLRWLPSLSVAGALVGHLPAPDACVRSSTSWPKLRSTHLTSSTHLTNCSRSGRSGSSGSLPWPENVWMGVRIEDAAESVNLLGPAGCPGR